MYCEHQQAADWMNVVAVCNQYVPIVITLSSMHDVVSRCGNALCMLRSDGTYVPALMCRWQHQDLLIGNGLEVPYIQSLQLTMS